MLNEISQPQKDKDCMIPLMTYLKQSNSQEQETERQGPELWGRGNSVQWAQSFNFVRCKSSSDLLHNNMTILTTIELDMSKW